MGILTGRSDRPLGRLKSAMIFPLISLTNSIPILCEFWLDHELKPLGCHASIDMTWRRLGSDSSLLIAASAESPTSVSFLICGFGVVTHSEFLGGR